jgi:hypothetical protein
VDSLTGVMLPALITQLLLNAEFPLRLVGEAVVAEAGGRGPAGAAAEGGGATFRPLLGQVEADLQVGSGSTLKHTSQTYRWVLGF